MLSNRQIVAERLTSLHSDYESTNPHDWTSDGRRTSIASNFSAASGTRRLSHRPSLKVGAASPGRTTRRPLTPGLPFTFSRTLRRPDGSLLSIVSSNARGFDGESREQLPAITGERLEERERERGRERAREIERSQCRSAQALVYRPYTSQPTPRDRTNSENHTNTEPHKDLRDCRISKKLYMQGREGSITAQGRPSMSNVSPSTITIINPGPWNVTTGASRAAGGDLRRPVTEITFTDGLRGGGGLFTPNNKQGFGHGHSREGGNPAVMRPRRSPLAPLYS